MKITAVIPIKANSQRCKNKSIRNFHDTTLLELRIKILKEVKGIDKIQVNTDCDKIIEKSRELGVETVKRDLKYATDETNGKMLYECLSESCDTDVILIAFTPTTFIEKNDYEECIKIFKTQKYDSVISVKKMNEYILHKKKAVNFDPLNTCRSQNLPEYFCMTFGVTILNTKFMKENHSIWTKNPYYYEVDQLKALDIDTNMDFLICEEIYKKNIRTLEELNRKNEENLLLDNFFNKKDIPEETYLGAVYDSLNTLVDNAKDYFLDIKPVCGYKKLIHGPALTLFGRKILDEENYNEMDKKRFMFYDHNLYESGPIVILQSNDNIISHTGDITSKIFKKLGAKGYITDGIARDIELIDEINFPIFSKNVNPIDAISNRWAYTDINIPININNLIIYPGDYIFASKDGVIVVPKKLHKSFLIKLKEIMDKEKKIRYFVDNCNKNNISAELKKFTEKHGRF